MMPIDQFLLTLLLNAAWQIVLISLVAALCARLLRETPARYKYLLWVSALSVSILLPVLSSAPVPRLDIPGPQTTISTITPLAEASPQILTGTLPEEMAAETSIPAFSVGPNLAIAIFAVYLLFVSFRGALLIRAWRRTRAFAQNAYEAAIPGSISETVEKCREATGATWATILFSDNIPVPVTIGNKVILPAAMLDETDTNILVTAIGHELVHVKRRDYFTNLFLELLCLPISFHPAVLFLKRRIDSERELCCDEAVADKLLRAEVYARSLVTIAGSASNLDRLSPAITVGIANAGNLEVRIMSLLKRPEISSYRKAFLILGAIVLLGVPCVVAAYFAPDVSIINSPDTVQNIKAGPTPPAVDEAAINESRTIEAKRERLKTALKEVQESDLDPAEKELRTVKIKQELGALLESAEKLNASAGEEDRRVLEEKLKELRAAGVGLEDRKLEIEKLKREFEMIAAGADTDEKKARLDELKMKLAATEDRLGATKEDLLKRDFDMAQKMEMERLSREATVRMDDAARIALGQRPGKVTENGIERSKEGEVVYKFVIRGDDGSNSVVVVSGMDGRIVRNQKIR